MSCSIGEADQRFHPVQLSAQTDVEKTHRPGDGRCGVTEQTRLYPAKRHGDVCGQNGRVRHAAVIGADPTRDVDRNDQGPHRRGDDRQDRGDDLTRRSAQRGTRARPDAEDPVDDNVRRPGPPDEMAKAVGGQRMRRLDARARAHGGGEAVLVHPGPGGRDRDVGALGRELGRGEESVPAVIPRADQEQDPPWSGIRIGCSAGIDLGTGAGTSVARPQNRPDLGGKAGRRAPHERLTGLEVWRLCGANLFRGVPIDHGLNYPHRKPNRQGNAHPASLATWFVPTLSTMGRVKPFLLLATRAEDEAADGEYAGFLAAGGLAARELVRVRLEQTALPPIDLENFSGVIVGGSPFNASDPEQAKSDIQRRVEVELAGLLDVIVERDFPFLGACYGIGLLGTHQRGIIDRTWSEPIGSTRVTLTAEGKGDPVFGACDGEFDAFVGHKEACSALPARAVLLAYSANCPVQGFRIGRNVYATQFHPELTVPAILTRIRVYRDYGYFAPDEMDALIAAAKEATITQPPKLMRAFVTRYARNGQNFSRRQLY